MGASSVMFKLRTCWLLRFFQE